MLETSYLYEAPGHDVAPIIHPEENPAAEADPRNPRRFRLGMPHLDADGLNRGWALREACHLHWWSIVGQFGTTPSRVTDTEGNRIFASVLACTMSGTADTFREDDVAEARLVRRPSAENGWLSQTDIVSDNGATLRIELMTAFAKRTDASNAALGRAEPRQTGPRAKRDLDRRRADLLTRIGVSDLRIARADCRPPHLSIRVLAPLHLNGVGLVYFAVLHDFVVQAELNALPRLGQAAPVMDRRLHYFGNLDPEDTLDLHSLAAVQALGTAPAVIVRTWGRRRSDDAVIVCAETLYRI